MKLLFKQRLFSWLDSYDIYDENEQTVYVVKGQLAIGHCLNIFDAAGDQLGTVRQKLLTWMPKYEIYEKEQYIGCISREAFSFRPRYDIDLTAGILRAALWNGTIPLQGQTVSGSQRYPSSFSV